MDFEDSFRISYNRRARSDFSELSGVLLTHTPPPGIDPEKQFLYPKHLSLSPRLDPRQQASCRHSKLGKKDIRTITMLEIMVNVKDISLIS